MYHPSPCSGFRFDGSLHTSHEFNGHRCFYQLPGDHARWPPTDLARVADYISATTSHFGFSAQLSAKTDFQLSSQKTDTHPRSDSARGEQEDEQLYLVPFLLGMDLIFPQVCTLSWMTGKPRLLLVTAPPNLYCIDSPTIG